MSDQARRIIVSGKLTLTGVVCLVLIGFMIIYLSLELIPSTSLKAAGLIVGLCIASVGGFSGRASALNLPAPFTNDPLGWRESKETYDQPLAEESKSTDDGST